MRSRRSACRCRQPFGFSRDAKLFVSRPGFDAAWTILGPGENSQTVRLQNAGGE